MGGVMANSGGTPRRPAKRVRCAIYTRKSSDEGLEQAFNSLDAQREACTAYILSQKHEGWTVLPAQYDDGPAGRHRGKPDRCGRRLQGRPIDASALRFRQTRRDLRP